MALGGVLPSEAELGIGLSVDQANVGGELIGGLRVGSRARRAASSSRS